jgi:NTE family protein
MPPRSGAPEYVERIGSDWLRIDLTIRQNPAARLPLAVHPALNALPVALRIQVRDGEASDYCRLARLISGTGRGLVLGGGGARGLAHLGVLRALEEAALPIDFVGGTSMGAIVAAGLAMGLNSAEIDAQTTGFFGRQNPLSDYTLPYIALTRGARVDAGLSAQFGRAQIEDLWLPYFCVSSNLTTIDALIHRRGCLTDALRASIAIPGLLPPFCAPEGVLVDGGMMNNLPADVMSAMQRGPVLAVDVGSDLAFQAARSRTWHGRLIRRLLRAPDDMPSIAPVLLRAATVSGDARTIMAVRQATVVLKPNLAGVDLRAWSSFKATSRLGYLCVKEAISQGRMTAWTHPDA